MHLHNADTTIHARDKYWKVWLVKAQRATVQMRCALQYVNWLHAETLYNICCLFDAEGKAEGTAAAAKPQDSCQELQSAG